VTSLWTSVSELARHHRNHGILLVLQPMSFNTSSLRMSASRSCVQDQIKDDPEIKNSRLRIVFYISTVSLCCLVVTICLVLHSRSSISSHRRHCPNRKKATSKFFSDDIACLPIIAHISFPNHFFTLVLGLSTIVHTNIDIRSKRRGKTIIGRELGSTAHCKLIE
jgi:hypothetical protein